MFDETRNRAYLQAMQACVGPDTVVLDLGAGVGVLGLLAAKAGARHVYCVEPSSVATQIKPWADANGVGDRITVLQSRIEQAELPEQVDLILSVFTGNLLFTEGLLPSLYHARDRYLKPGGILLPDRARLLLQPVQAGNGPGAGLARFRAESLGLDFSGLADAAASQPITLRRDAPLPRGLGSPVIVTELDFETTTQADVAFAGSTRVTQAGAIDALLGWIEIRLGDAWLSTAADAPEVHWSPVLLPFAQPLDVGAGDVLDIGFRHIDDERMHWTVSHAGVHRRQSTMQHNPDLLIDMQLSSPECLAPLGAEGRIVAEVLAGIAGGASNRAIAERLVASHPGRHPDVGTALKAVGRIAARYRRHPARSE